MIYHSFHFRPIYVVHRSHLNWDTINGTYHAKPVLYKWLHFSKYTCTLKQISTPRIRRASLMLRTSFVAFCCYDLLSIPSHALKASIHHINWKPQRSTGLQAPRVSQRRLQRWPTHSFHAWSLWLKAEQ